MLDGYANDVVSAALPLLIYLGFTSRGRPPNPGTARGQFDLLMGSRILHIHFTWQAKHLANWTRIMHCSQRLHDEL